MSRFAPGGLALALLAFPCALARGDDAPPPGGEDRPEVRLDEVVVRLPRPDPAAPGSASTVVDAERYAGEAKSVAELVATAPGVAVREYGGLGHLATVSLRGSTSDGVRVFLDGLPLNSAFGGGVNLSSIPRQWISAIEVVRGAEGARFGSGAMGGVVNVVTRGAGETGWSAQLSRGSFDSWSAGADAGWGGARWGALVSLAYDETSGAFRYRFDPQPTLPGNPLESRVRENNEGRSGGVLAKAFVTGSAGRTDVLAQLAAGRHGLPGWPYALTPRDGQEDLRAALALRHALPVGDRLVARGEVLARHDRLDTRLGTTFHQRGTAAQATAALTWTPPRQRVDAGVTAGGERLDSDGLGGRRSRPELAAFLADELRVGDRVRIAPALRVERLGGFSGWSGKLGAEARLAGPLSIRASGGRTFRAPGFAELHLQQGILQPNPDLVPEDGVGVDAALVADAPLGVVRAGGFAQLYRDLIVYEPASFQRIKPFNAGRAAVRGLEVEAASARRGPLGLQGSLAYTWLVSENLRGEEAVLGKDLPHRARHRVVARLAASRGAYEAHVELHHVGEQYQDRRNLVRIPDATTGNAGASLRVVRAPDVRVHLEVRNLLDARDLQDGFGNPLPGRMVLVTLRAGSRQPRGEP